MLPQSSFGAKSVIRRSLRSRPPSGHERWCCDSSATPQELLACAGATGFPSRDGSDETGVRDDPTKALVVAQVPNAAAAFSNVAFAGSWPSPAGSEYVHWSAVVNSAWAASSNHKFRLVDLDAHAPRPTLQGTSHCKNFARMALKVLAEVAAFNEWVLYLEADAVLVDFGNDFTRTLLTEHAVSESTRVLASIDFLPAIGPVVCTAAMLYKNTPWTKKFFESLLAAPVPHDESIDECSVAPWQVHAADLNGHVRLLPSAALSGAREGPVMSSPRAQRIVRFAATAPSIRAEVLRKTWLGLCAAARESEHEQEEDDDGSKREDAMRGEIDDTVVDAQWGLRLQGRYFALALAHDQAPLETDGSALDCSSMLQRVLAATSLATALDTARWSDAADALRRGLKHIVALWEACPSLVEPRSGGVAAELQMIAGSLALGLARLGYASEAGAAASSARGLVGHAPRTAPERAAHAGLLLQLGRTAEAETEARSAVFFLAPHGSDNAKDQLFFVLDPFDAFRLVSKHDYERMNSRTPTRPLRITAATRDRPSRRSRAVNSPRCHGTPTSKSKPKRSNTKPTIPTKRSNSGHHIHEAHLHVEAQRANLKYIAMK